MAWDTLHATDEPRRQSIIEWRASVQAAFDGSSTPGSPVGGDNAERVSSPGPSSPPPAPSRPVRRRSWRAKLSAAPIWPWLARTSHCCGRALLLAFVQATSLAVEDGDYRDSFNALGVDTVEYQWQTWDLASGTAGCESALAL